MSRSLSLDCGKSRLVFSLFHCSMILMCAVYCWFHAPHSAQAALKLGEKNPVEGKPTSVLITDNKNAPVMGAELVVTYNPFSNTERIRVVNLRSDSGGILLWTPESAGLVVLQARIQRGTDRQGKPQYKIVASTTLGVKYKGLPISGLIVFLVAGAFLFGGMAYGFAKAFAQDL